MNKGQQSGGWEESTQSKRNTMYINTDVKKPLFSKKLNLLSTHLGVGTATWW